jgi:hypothetical protein
MIEYHDRCWRLRLSIWMHHIVATLFRFSVLFFLKDSCFCGRLHNCLVVVLGGWRLLVWCDCCASFDGGFVTLYEACSLNLTLLQIMLDSLSIPLISAGKIHCLLILVLAVVNDRWGRHDHSVMLPLVIWRCCFGWLRILQRCASIIPIRCCQQVARHLLVSQLWCGFWHWGDTAHIAIVAATWFILMHGFRRWTTTLIGLPYSLLRKWLNHLFVLVSACKSICHRRRELWSILV